MKHLILGAGPAGVIAAETIRKHAPHDEIVIVGDEPEAPYSRMAIPYLLIGDIDESGTHLRHATVLVVQMKLHRAAAARFGGEDGFDPSRIEHALRRCVDIGRHAGLNATFQHQHLARMRATGQLT